MQHIVPKNLSFDAISNFRSRKPISGPEFRPDCTHIAWAGSASLNITISLPHPKALMVFRENWNNDSSYHERSEHRHCTKNTHSAAAVFGLVCVSMSVGVTAMRRQRVDMQIARRLHHVVAYQGYNGIAMKCEFPKSLL